MVNDSNKKPRIFIYQLAILFFWFSQYAYVPNLSTYAKELGVSLTVIGMITGSYGLGQTLLRVPLGLLSDRLGKRKIFVCSGFITALTASLLFYFFEQPYMMIVARTVAGFAAAAWVVATVLYSSYFDPNESPRAMSRLTICSYSGQAIAMGISGALVLAFHGYKPMFLVAAAGALIGFVLSLFITEKVPEKKKEASLSDFLHILTDKRLMYISCATLIIEIFLQSTGSGFTPIIATNLGANSLTRSLLSIDNLILAIIGASLSNLRCMKKIPDFIRLAICPVGFAIVAVLCPFAASLTQLFFIQALSGLCHGYTFSFRMGLAIRHFPDNQRARAMGVYQTMYGFGMFIGPLLAGAIGDRFGLTVSYLMIAALCLLIIPFDILWAKENKRANASV